MKSAKTIILITSLTLAGMLFATPAMAEYSPWMKIRKIESYGKVLAKRKLVPTKIECKRGPGRVYWRNTLLRLKLVSVSKVRITGWKVSITQAYEGGRNRMSYYRRYFDNWMIVPPGPSGISAHCGIVYHTKNNKKFSTKKRRRR